MKKILATAFFATLCLALNAKEVNYEIITSCGDVYKISEVGDDITIEDIVEFAIEIDNIFCGE